MMGAQVSLVLFVLGFGFVAAGLLNALHQVMVPVSDDEQIKPLVLSFDTPIGIAWSMIICVFAGPYLVLSNGLHFWRLSVLPTPALVTCGVLSAIWSFCSGVFLVEIYLLLA